MLSLAKYFHLFFGKVILGKSTPSPFFGNLKCAEVLFLVEICRALPSMLYFSQQIALSFAQFLEKPD
jgi:hypothetical protein